MSISGIQLGSTVQVAVRDIVCPDFLELRQWVGPDFLMSGKVTFFSDSGSQRRLFAVLFIEGISQSVIASVSDLMPFSRKKDNPSVKDMHNEAEMIFNRNGMI